MSILMDELKKAEQQHLAHTRRKAPPRPVTPATATTVPAAPAAPENKPAKTRPTFPALSTLLVRRPEFSPSIKRTAIVALALTGLTGLALSGANLYRTLPSPRASTPLPATQPSPPIHATLAQSSTATTMAPTPLTPDQHAQTLLQQGDLAAAQAAFQKIVAEQPGNLPAWHGLAESSLQQGQLAQAEEAYLQILKLNPKDLKAQDGLIEVQQSGGDPRQIEIRLQALLAAHPELAFLNYGLGNLYVSQERWGQAQTAFLKAYQSDPEQPDYLFSLAVSLDYLGRTATARQLYRLALTAAEHHPTRFSPQQARKRLESLQ